MGEDSPFNSAKKDEILKQLIIQRKELEREEKKSAIATSLLVCGISILLFYLSYTSIQVAGLSIVAGVVEIGTILFIIILILQFDSLSREIKGIIPKYVEWDRILNPSVRSRRIGEIDIEILEKAYDVNKNTIDKLFEKLKTFSNTWLVVSGGIATSFLIEILKSETLNAYSAFVLIVCSALLWSIAQDLYGILDYELAKKTKDLAYWWIATVKSRGR